MNDVSNRPPHRKFQSIPRLNRDVMITEKIDGTNSLICITDDLTMHVGSRNRWITPDDDNYGFAKWAYMHADELKGLGPGMHYGEWFGQGIQRRYGLKEKHFALFNVSRWNKDNIPPCCDVVPIIYSGPIDRWLIDDAVSHLCENGSQMVPGFPDPEGIVVFHTASNHLYKYTFDGDGHKGRRNEGV